MIVLNVLCEAGHRFEGWFASTEAFHSQCQRQLVNCPHCQTAQVSLLPSAPHVRRSVPAEVVPPSPESMSAVAARLVQALSEAARKAENVGERFPEEARRIHYDEAPARSIRGVASHDETMELLDEGIFVLPAPVPRDDEIH